MKRLRERVSRLNISASNPLVLSAVFGLLILCSFVPLYSSDIMANLPKPNVSWEAFFSFAQFISSVLLIPVILLGFEFQRREFEAAQARPVLELAFRDLEGQLASEIVVQPLIGQGLATFEVRMELFNKGEAVATMYKVELGNLEPLGFGPAGYSEWFEEIGVLAQDWRDQTRTQGPLVFLGLKNEYAIFPKQGISICRLAINLPSTNLLPEFFIPYTLYSGITHPRTGTLRLRLQEAKLPTI